MKKIKNELYPKNIFFILILNIVTASLLHAGQDQIDIMEKEYSKEEVESYFKGFMDVVDRPYFAEDTVLILDIGSFTVIKKLGSGNEGIVYLVKNAAGEKFALKLPFYGSQDPGEVAQYYIKPLKLLKTLDHPNIIKVDPNSKFMIMEHADGTVAYLEASSLESKNSFFVSIVQQVIKAMEYLKSMGIEFNDLHAANIVYFEEEGGDSIKVKIIDINGKNNPYAKPFLSIKSFIQELYYNLKMNKPGLLALLKATSNVEEMKTILDAEKPENTKVLRRIRSMDLAATKEKIRLRRQGKYFNEPSKQSKRHGIHEDDEGAAGGACR